MVALINRKTDVYVENKFYETRILAWTIWNNKNEEKKLGKVYLMQTLHSNKDCEGCLKLGGYDSIILYSALLKNKPDKCSFA